MFSEIIELCRLIDTDWLAKRPIPPERSYRCAATLRALCDAVESGGFDLSPCGACGRPVVCIPDGLPMCDRCAREETNDG